MENKRVFFFEDEHKYKDLDSGEIYTSVTQLINSYKKPFNEQLWGAYTTLKSRGMAVYVKDDKLYSKGKLLNHPTIDASQVLSQWKEKKDKACEQGTFVHSYIENLAMKKFINVPDKYYEISKVAEDYFFTVNPIIVAREKVMHCPIYKVAGTCDAEELGRVTDYKTNEDIEKPGYNNLLGPVSDLTDSKLDVYKLQLNLYQYLIGTPLLKRIVHITETDWKIYEVEDYDVIPLLEDFKNKQNENS